MKKIPAFALAICLLGLGLFMSGCGKADDAGPAPTTTEIDNGLKNVPAAPPGGPTMAPPKKGAGKVGG